MTPSSSPLRELFFGRVRLSEFGSYPHLSRARYQQIEPVLAALRSSPSARGIALLRSLDLLTKPEGLALASQARLVSELGATDPSAALSFIAHHALGLQLLRRFGSDPLNQRVPKDSVFAFALTEASPGSDVSQVQTLAVPVPGGYRLRGHKNWVTNGLYATHVVVVARTTSPQPGNKPRLTTFLVEPGPGYQMTPARSDVLPGAGVAELRLEDVFVPRENLIGPFGKGFRPILSGLSDARLLLSAAISGACRRAYIDTIERLHERRAFGRPVGNFPSVQDRVALLLTDTFALESLVHLVAALGSESKQSDPVERGLSRLAASRISARVLDVARELHGAAAFSGDLTQSRRWADTRALALLDGSDLALESFIALEGTREVRKSVFADHEFVDAWHKLDALGQRAVHKLKSTVLRAFPHDVPGGRVQVLESLAGELGVCVLEQLSTHGPEFVERQHVHRRVANAAMDLSVWFAVVLRVHAEIKRSSEVGAQRMIDAAELFTSGAELRVRLQFEQLRDNQDALRDRVARRAYTDGGYPFDVC